MTPRGKALRLAGAAITLVLAQVCTGAVGLDGPAGAAATAAGSGGNRSAAAAPAAPTATLAPPVDPTKPRVAFTDDRDALGFYGAGGGPIGLTSAASLAAPPQQGGFQGPTSPAFANGAAVHEGEASLTVVPTPTPTRFLTFVSTRDSASGEVYVNRGADTYRLTCNTGKETHPVMSPDGRFVAYASGGRIRVVQLDPAAPANCASDTSAEVANQSGDDEWPTWVASANTPGGQFLVYSSTRDNPLGDLYAQVGGFGGIVDQGVTRLTDGGGTYGTTQPRTVRNYSGGPTPTPWVLLATTTKFRSDGSLGEVVGTGDAVPATADLPLATVSAWRDGDELPQSSEAATTTDAVAFTSTAANPLGGVLYAIRRTPTGTEPPFVYDPTQLRSLYDVSFENRPTSHPVWVDGDLLVTYRRVDADVTDAQSDDGSDRDQVAPSTPADAATPAYSPDGSRIAYSVRQGTDAGTGRRLYIANADGSNPVAVADGFTAQAAPNGDGVTHYDLWPSWSPDGTKLAFVRAAYQYRQGGRFTEFSRAIWIATVPDDLSTGTATRLTTGDDGSAVYGHPTWSPDGARIVVSRSTVPTDLRVQLTVPASVNVDVPFTVTATVDNLGGGTSDQSVVGIDAPANVAFDTGNLPAGCSGTATRVECDLGSLDAGRRAIRSITATASAPFTNEQVTADTNTASDDYNDTNDDASATLSAVRQPADLGLTLTAPANIAVTPGTVTVLVTNNGPGTARTPVVTISIDSSDDELINPNCADGNADPLVFTCTLPDMPAGGTQTVTVTLRQKDCGKNTPGTVEVKAGVTSTSPDNNQSNNNRSATVTQLGSCPALRAPLPGESAPGATLPSGAGFLLSAGGPVVSQSAYTASESRGFGTTPFAVDPPRIVLIDVATGTRYLVHTCTNQPADRCPLYGSSPSWAPTGDRIAYDDGGQLNIAQLQDDPNSAGDTTPDLAPPADTDALVGFTSYTSGTGGAPTSARTTLETAHDPAWAPDGFSIYFTGQPAGQPSNAGIYAITPTGTGLRAVAQNAEPESEPTVQPTVDLTVTATALPTVVTVGQDSTVTVRLTNPGTIRAANTVLTVTVPTGLSVGTPPTGCTAAAVPTGTTLTCDLGALPANEDRTFDVTVTGQVLGTYTVTAQATTNSVDRNPSDNTATATITVRQFSTDVSVTLTSDPAVIILGDDATLTANVANGGAERALAVTLTVTIADGLTPDPSTVPAGCTLTGQVLTCVYGDLLPGETRTAAVVVGAPTVGSYVSTASVSTGSDDTDKNNNTASAATQVRRYLADVSVSLTADPGTVLIGDTSTLRARVRNNGSELALNTVLQVQIGADLVPGSAPPGCTLAARTLTCAFGDLLSKAVRTVEITVTGPTLGDQTSTATVSTDSNDEISANNVAFATVRVVRRLADVAVSVAFTRGVAYVGGAASARVTVRNVGPNPAENVRLDTLFAGRLRASSSPSCAAGASTCDLGTLAPGESRTYAIALKPAGITPTPRNYRSTAVAVVTTTSDEAVTANNADRAELLVRQPRVRLLPPIGPPGFVTVVFGEQLPPGSLVRLAWSTGITSTNGAVRVAADGTVQSPMLVVRRDGDLGPRLLVVTSIGARFSRITADMLVVPRTQSPPDFVGRG